MSFQIPFASGLFLEEKQKNKFMFYILSQKCQGKSPLLLLIKNRITLILKYVLTN
jgi:hypothetical protein